MSALSCLVASLAQLPQLTHTQHNLSQYPRNFMKLSTQYQLTKMVAMKLNLMIVMFSYVFEAIALLWRYSAEVYLA